MERRLAIAMLALVTLAGSSATGEAGPAPGDSTFRSERDYGVSLALRGEVGRAETTFVALVPNDDPAAWTGLGNLHAMRGEFASALGFYARAQRADSADAGILLDRSIVLQLMGREDAARAEAERGVRMAGGEERAAALLALGSESGKAVEFSRVFEIPVPKKRAIRFGSWNVRQLIAPPDSISARARNASTSAPLAAADTKSAPAQPANPALLFYWKH